MSRSTKDLAHELVDECLPILTFAKGLEAMIDEYQASRSDCLGGGKLIDITQQLFVGNREEVDASRKRTV